MNGGRQVIRLLSLAKKSIYKAYIIKIDPASWPTGQEKLYRILVFLAPVL